MHQTSTRPAGSQARDMTEVYLAKIHYWVRVIGLIVVIGFIAGLFLGISAVENAHQSACQSQGGTVQGC